MVNKCGACSAELLPDDSFCGECGASVPSSAAFTPYLPGPVASPKPPVAGPLTTPANTGWEPTAIDRLADDRIGDIKLAHNEKIMKVYPVAQVRRPLGSVKGSLILTDARVIYRAAAVNSLNSSRSSREVQLSQISGLALETRKGMTSIGFVGTLGGAIIVIFGLIAAFKGLSLATDYDTGVGVAWLFLLFWLALAVGLIVGVVRMVRATRVVMLLLAQDTSTSPIGFSGESGSDGVNFFSVIMAMLFFPLLALMRYLGVLHSSSVADDAEIARTQAMYDELGALILDIQSRGVRAEVQ